MTNFLRFWLAVTVVIGTYAIVWGYNQAYDAGYKDGTVGMYDAGFDSGLNEAEKAYENYIAGNCSCKGR